MAKGEIAHHEQFLLLQHCFQKASAAEASRVFCMRERVNCLSDVIYIESSLGYGSILVNWKTNLYIRVDNKGR